MGIKEYTSNGKVYRYWRRKGAPAIPIDPQLKGAALAAEIARLEARYVRPKAIPGTFRLLVVEYKKNSDHWRSLRTRTRQDYERVFKWFGDDGLDTPLVEITVPEVAKTRDKARNQHEPKFANQVVTVLKKVFAYGVEQGIAEINPALQISRATGGARRQNRPCTPGEANALMDLAPAHLKPAIALAIYTGLRLGDVAGVSRAADQGEWLEIVQGKTRKPLLCYICPDLRRILDRVIYDRAIEASTLNVKANGQPWAYEGLKTAFQRHRDALVSQDTIARGVTFHGLRHTSATILAEAGYSEDQLAHFLGHGPRTISGHYARSAEHRTLLKNMALTVENVLRQARGNVLNLHSK